MLKKYFYVFMLTIYLFSLSSAGCMFSTYSINNSHIGQCSYFTNNITYDGTFNLTNESCGSQDFIIGFKQINDSHVSGDENFYSWRLCSNDTECEVTALCLYDEVGSLYQMNDSHFGSPDFYDLKLCCERVGRGGGGANLTAGAGGVTEEIIEEEDIVDKVMELIEGNAFWFISVMVVIVILIIVFICFIFFIFFTRKRKKEES